MELKYSMTLTKHICYLKACPLNTPTLRPGVNFSLKKDTKKWRENRENLVSNVENR